MTKLPLRPNVCLIILNKKNKIFLGERSGNPGVWQFPQGGVEEGDTIEANALREAHEEMGVPLETLEIIKQLNARHDYDFLKVPEYARGKWRGQTQTFWLLRFSGSEEDIELDRYEDELMDWKWCSVKEVRALAEPRRLAGYEKALPEVESFLKTMEH